MITETIRKAYGKDLLFISRINRDGLGVTLIQDVDLSFLDSDEFVLNRLSITENTWIASGFNTFIVKLK